MIISVSVCTGAIWYLSNGVVIIRAAIVTRHSMLSHGGPLLI